MRPAGVGHVVVDHAHQPDAEGYRRIPAVIHDPVEVGVGQTGDIREGRLVNGVVVLAKWLGVNHHRLNLVRRMPVPVVGGSSGSLNRSTQPADVRDLLGPGGARDVVVPEMRERCQISHPIEFASLSRRNASCSRVSPSST